jgi:transcription elongation factor GreA
MATKETQITAEGLKKLEEELAQRKGPIREEIVERLKEARAQGDLSENSEYDQAKEDQGKNEGRILELEMMIKTAVIIDTSASGREGVVSLGCTVLLKDMETGEEESYTVVGTTEADPFNNRISNESPVGAAILGKEVHDVVAANTPAGELSYEILEIKY